jgi:lycopene beta-cyclase
MKVTQCDIIISGAGMAGLSLLYRAMKENVWVDKKIIVIDENLKKTNDKTWSFWKRSEGPFDFLAHSTWNNLLFFNNNGRKIQLDCGPYIYNSIRSIDFYDHVLGYLNKFKNIEFVEAVVSSTDSEVDGCKVLTEDTSYKCKYLFNSVFKKPKIRKDDQYLLQHFKGYKIKTKYPLLDASVAYLMDFRTSQENGTSFIYTLPLKDDEIFVEYTIFSENLIKRNEYDLKIRTYLLDILKCKEFEVLEEEYGVIPMTDYEFIRREGNVINIGSIGGDTRGSTGYTFMNVQKTVGAIIASFKKYGHPYILKESIGFKEKLYDTTLLNVLAKSSYKGHQLFSDLFSSTKASVVFSFLDAETNLVEDLKIMKSLRVMPFLKAFIFAIKRQFRFRS